MSPEKVQEAICRHLRHHQDVDSQIAQALTSKGLMCPIPLLRKVEERAQSIVAQVQNRGDRKTENEHALYSPIEESERRLGLDENISGGKEGEGRSDSSNILDDMEKFQREIDELRTRYKQAG
ncbi:unnamed protein product [Alternaria alternata]